MCRHAVFGRNSYGSESQLLKVRGISETPGDRIGDPIRC
jgi:hypothetical protein